MEENFELDPKLNPQGKVESTESDDELKVSLASADDKEQAIDPGNALRGVPSPQVDDSILDQVLDDVVKKGTETNRTREQRQRTPAQGATITKHLESRILHHDKEMTECKYSKDGHYYTDGFRRITFVREKDSIRAHVFLGYDLSNFVLEEKTIRDVPVMIGNKHTTLDLYLVGLGRKYLTMQERKCVSIGIDIEKSRVVFEYSVAYDPDDEQKLQESLRIITGKANKLHEVMAGKIKTRTGQDKEAVYLTKDEVKDTYRTARTATRQPKQ